MYCILLWNTYFPDKKFSIVYTNIYTGSSSERSGFSEQAEYSEVIELRSLEFENRLLFLEKTEKTG
jgi:hypothetical protein